MATWLFEVEAVLDGRTFLLILSVVGAFLSIVIQMAYVMHRGMRGKAFVRLFAVGVVVYGGSIHLGVLLGWWDSSSVGVLLLRPIAWILWLLPAFDALVDWNMFARVTGRRLNDKVEAAHES